MGPEYLALGLTFIVSAVTGSGWAIDKLLRRQQEKLDHVRKRVDILEDQNSRMPIEYVLKVDFLREIKEMQDNFREINHKLDKLIEKLLSK